MSDPADSRAVVDTQVDADALLLAQGLTKRYDGRAVVDGVDLQVRQGEVKAIIGPSGSGKSTMLRLLALLEHADEGGIWFNGKRIGSREAQNGHSTRLSERQLVRHRRGIGMVFQRFNLFPHLNASENVSLALRLAMKKSRSEALAQATEMLAKVGLSHRERAYPSELSGGEQQRVAIARALVLNPSLLLFDEPTSALDPELVKSVLDVMTDLAESGMTMIVVTHEIGFARSVADHVVMFDNARIVEEGRPANILSGGTSERTRAFLQHLL